MKIWQKTIAVISTFALLFNSIAAPLAVLAQEETPSPTPEATTQPTDTPTPADTATPEATVEATATPEATPDATPAEIVTPAPEATTESTDLVTPTPTDQPVETQAPESNPTVQGPPTATPTVTPEAPTENGHISALILKDTKVDASAIDQFDLTYQTDGSATISTDKLDYSPTDTAVITGVGFTAGKTYTIYITSSDTPAVNFSDSVTANDKGEILYSYTLDGISRPNYKVEVKDGERVVASDTFTDPPAPLTTTTYIYNLQPSWTAIGGGGVFAAYIGPPSYVYVSPGSTAVYDGREAGIIKAGLATDPDDGHYWDEGLLAFQTNVSISSFASQTLSYDVENQTGPNPVWVRIRLTDANQTEYQFVPTTNPAGWHTVNAAAGQWQLMDGNGNATGDPMTLTQVAAVPANAGLSVDRIYLTLGMGDSYNVSPGVGTVAWVDKVTIGSVIYDFVTAGTNITPPNCTSGVLNGDGVSTTVQVVLTCTNITKFVSSGTTTADATDRAKIKWDAVDHHVPSSAVISGDQLTLTFNAEDGTFSQDINIDSGAFSNNSDIANNAISISSSSITDHAKPKVWVYSMFSTPQLVSTTAGYGFGLSDTEGGNLTIGGGCSIYETSIGWTNLWTNLKWGGGAFPDGIYNSCTITLTDAAGNSGTGTIPTFVVDTTGPVTNSVTVSPMYSTGGVNYISALSTISGSVTDAGTGVDGSSCEYSRDGVVSDFHKDPTSTYIGGVCLFTNINTSGATGINVRAQYDNAVPAHQGVYDPTKNVPVIVDSTAPTTVDNVPSGWQASATAVTLTCNDGSGSGCAKVYYTTNGGTPTTSSNFVDASSSWQFTVSLDGQYTIKYFGIDNVGNQESVKTSTNALRIDRIAPTLTVTGFTADGAAIPGNLTDGYTLNTDNITSHEYLVQFAAGTSADETLSNEYFGLTLKSSTVSAANLKAYYAARGTPEPFLTYLDNAVDGTKPFVYINGNTVKLVDAARHDILGGADTDMAIPGDYPSGTYVVEGKIKDLAGNETTATYKLIVVGDSTPPVISKVVTGTVGTNGWYTSDVTVTWTVTDPESAVVIDSGCGTQDFTSETTGTNSTCSAHSVGGSSSDSVTLKIDKTAPTYAWNSPAVGSVYADGQSISVDANITEAGSGITDGANCYPVIHTTVGYFTGSVTYSTATGKCTGNITLTKPSGLADGAHYITLQVTDKSGNSAISSNRNIVIDNTAPTVVLTDDHPDSIVRDADTVIITATFTEVDQIDEVTPPTISIHSVNIVNNAPMTKVSNLVWTYTWDVPSGSNGTHTVSISAKDRAGNSNAVATGKTSYTIDNIAPTTTPSVYSNPYVFGNWTNGQITMRMSCDDGAGSGCTSTFYCVDQTDTCTPTTLYAGFNVNTEGVNYIRFYSTDNAGNSETVKSVQVKIDTTRPVATDDYGAKDGIWQNSNQTITLTASDSGGSGLQWTKYCFGTTLNNGVACYPESTGTECSNPASCSISVTDEGARYITYVSQDIAGTRSNYVTRLIKIDKTAPTVGTITITPSYLVGGNLYITSLSTISAPVTDAGGSGIDPASCRYSIDDDISGSITVPSAYDSVNHECVFSNIDTSDAIGMAISVDDNAGNFFDITNSWINNFTVDKNPPATNADAGAYSFGNWINQDVSVTLACTDSGTGCRNIYWCYDDGSSVCTPEGIYSDPLGFTAEGDWYLRYYSDDNAGNPETVKTQVIKIDKTAPVITIDSYNTNPTNQNITVTASTNEGTLNSTSHEFTDNGSFDFVATDAAGNTTTQTVNITNIDKEPPTAPIATPAGGSYYSDQTVSLTAEAGAEIRYTTDGTTPTDSTGTVYTGTILVGVDTVIKAIAIDLAGNVSPVMTESYGIAPLISAEGSSSATSDSVTITWTTDDLSTSRVVYDTVSHTTLDVAPNYGYAFSTIEDSTKVTPHSVTITGLSSGTTYYYRVISHGSPEAVGDELSFKTTATVATTTNNNSGGTGTGDGLGCAVHDCSGNLNNLQTQVLGLTAGAWPKLAYAGTGSTGENEENVLGTETNATASPEVSAAPAAQAGKTNLINWILTHKKISLGVVLIIILIGFLINKKKKS